MRRLRLLAGLAASLGASGALAHPHVWVEARAELLYGPDARIEAVRHRWTFDEGYSSFAVQGLDANGDGRTSSTELAELTRTNMASLEEYKFFTALKANGAKQVFGPPRGESMSYEGGRLTLTFDLPLATPAPGRVVVLDTYDPTFFVDFRTAPGGDAVTLAGAPAGCSVRIARPKATPPPAGQSLSDSLYQSLSASSGFGDQFASHAMIACP